MDFNSSGEILSNLPAEIVSRLGTLITIFEAVGWMILLYIVFNIVNTFLNRKKQKEFREMNQTLKEIKTLLKSKKKI